MKRQMMLFALAMFVASCAIPGTGYRIDVGWKHSTPTPNIQPEPEPLPTDIQPTAPVPVPAPNMEPVQREPSTEPKANFRPLGLLGNNVLYLGHYPGRTAVSKWDANAAEFTHYFAEGANGVQWGLYAAKESYDGKNTSNGYLFKGTKKRFALALRQDGAASQTEARLFSEQRDDNGHSSTWKEERETDLVGIRLANNKFRHDHRYFSELSTWAEWKHQLSGDRKAWLNGVNQKVGRINYGEDRYGIAADLVHKRWHDNRMRLALGLVAEESIIREDSSNRLLGAARLRYSYRTVNWTQYMFDVQYGKSWNTGVEDTDIASFNFSLSF